MLEVFSLFHSCFFNNKELKIFGRHQESNPGLCIKQAVLGSIPGGDQIFCTSVLFKKACERERIHLMSKKKKAEKEKL